MQIERASNFRASGEDFTLRLGKKIKEFLSTNIEEEYFSLKFIQYIFYSPYTAFHVSYSTKIHYRTTIRFGTFFLGILLLHRYRGNRYRPYSKFHMILGTYLEVRPYKKIMSVQKRINTIF